jgi:hypothetical protein
VPQPLLLGLWLGLAPCVRLCGQEPGRRGVGYPIAPPQRIPQLSLNFLFDPNILRLRGAAHFYFLALVFDSLPASTIVEHLGLVQYGDAAELPA